MAWLCRDFFTSTSGSIERLVGHTDTSSPGNEFTWANIDDGNPAGISPSDLFIEPGGTIYHSGYSTITGAASTAPAFQVTPDSYGGTDFYAEWTVVNMGAYKVVSPGDGGVGPGDGGVHASERGSASGTYEMWDYSDFAGGGGGGTSWTGISTDGTSDNGVTTSSAQLWAAFDDTAYTGMYISVDGASIALVRSDSAASSTILGTYTSGVAAGQSRTISLVRSGSSVTVSVDGSSVITCVEAAYTSSSKRFGIRIDGGASQLRGIHIDSFYAYSVAAPPVTVGSAVLSGSCNDPETATLTWTSASNASTYELYRVTDSGGSVLIHSGPSTSCTEDGRSIGYWTYRVRGIGSDNTPGPYSNLCTVFVDTGFFLSPMPDASGNVSVKTTFITRGAKPVDYWDGSAGRLCPVSGMWFPGSQLVSVDGIIVGTDYSHLPQRPAPELPDVF